jgi:pyridoxamine 5'-phosphate oxidase
MDPNQLDPDPLVQFEAWLDDARAVSPSADAMTLATSTADGRPSARIVLLRGLDSDGFVFFTNRESRKGDELSANPQAALVFHWWDLGRQVRIEGDVKAVDDVESSSYWRTRPRASRIAAWASPQSQPISGRSELEGRYAAAKAELGEAEIPLPPFWGGYRVTPNVIEFWAHRDDRLHDRIRYARSATGWRRERLAP